MRILLAIILCAFVAAAAGCAGGLSSADREAVLAYSEAKTDNLLAGFNNNDYPTFSRDFDDAMKKSMDQSAFSGLLQDMIKGRIGRYVSRQMSTITRDEKFITVVYNAAFEQETGVTMRVVFTASEDHLITGLWFDSPKLRQK